MLRTSVTQLRYAASLLRGARLRPADLRRTIDDLHATIAELGLPPELASGGAAAAGPDMADEDVAHTIATRRLRRTVRLALERTPYYRALAERLPDAAHLHRSVSDTDPYALPVTAKRALRADPNAFVAAGATPAFLALTTGTSGAPAGVWFSDHEIELAAALSALAFVQRGMGTAGSNHVYATTVSSRAALSLAVTHRAMALARVGFVQLGIVDPATALGRLTAAAGRERPVTHLAAYPSYLAQLAAVARARGLGPEAFALQEIHCGGEILTDVARARAEDVFGAPVVEAYSMTEIAPVAGGVCTAGHLHIARDQGLVEVLDPDGDPVPPGAIGTLVVTPYAPYRDTSFVLRYDTGDLVRRLSADASDEVACELRAIPATSRVLGRASSPLGASEHAIRELLDADPALAPPLRLAARAAPDGQLSVALPGPDSPALAAELTRRAAADGLAHVRFVVRSELAGAAENGAWLGRPRADLVETTFETPAAAPGQMS